MSKLDRAFIRAYTRDRNREGVEITPVEVQATSPVEYPTRVDGEAAPVGVVDRDVPTHDLLSTEEIYGLTRRGADEGRILRADGPVGTGASVPRPHAEFGQQSPPVDVALAGDLIVPSADDPAFASGEDLPEDQALAATVIEPIVLATQHDIDAATARIDDSSAELVRVYFGDDSPLAAADETHDAAESRRPHDEHNVRPRPTLSLYRGTTWEESWDTEPADRNGLFGEASDEPPAAAFDVPRFAWPAMCDTLIRTAGQLFESLCDALVTAGHDGHNRVVFTSTRRGAGATTIALAAARRLAGDGHSVVLVDANWRAPQLAARLGLRPQSGWREIIDERLPPDEALIESRDDRVCLLPLVERADSPTAEIDAAALAAHVARLGRHFDLVIVDAGPLDVPATDDFDLTAHLVNLADVAILVQDMRAGESGDYERWQQTLDRAGLAWWGTVENFVPAA